MTSKSLFRLGLSAAWAAVLVVRAGEGAPPDWPNPPWRDTGGFGRIETVEGRRLAVVEVPPDRAAGQHWFEAPVDLAPFTRGAVVLTIRARWRGVTRPPQRWNGVKFLLNYVDGGGKSQWHHPVGLSGDRDWGALSVLLRVKEGSRDGRIALGLQDSSGRVEFDLDSLRLDAAFRPDDRVNMAYKVSYPERVAKDVRRRGVMSPHTMTEDDFKTLRDWNVNLLRYQIMRNWGKVDAELDLEEYDAWIAGKLDHLEQVCRWAAAYGVKVVVDLHTPPGGSRAGADGMAMFYEEKYRDHYLAVWRRIAERFKGNPAVHAYDLINEPWQKIPGAPFDYWSLQKAAAEAVRAVDPDATVMIESNEADIPASFAYLSPLAMDNVVYQVHMYQPGPYTHQGVHIDEPLLAYPGEIGGEYWDKERLRENLAPVRAFQLRHDARIYVGEFSAIAWAPGAEKYLRDCIELFEEYGWDWSYHAFREWNGWSVEHEGEDRKSLRPAADTPRKQVLLEYFARNVRAGKGEQP